jgi:2-oxoglutarate dehydrogenase E1 component
MNLKIIIFQSSAWAPVTLSATRDMRGVFPLKMGKIFTSHSSPNPSHLAESVDPLVEGRCKALQELQGAGAAKVLPILIHGDASVAGQGVVYETLQLSRVDGYSTGGTLHVVIDNQIGFTTTPSESRSTMYCTDIAKAFDCPVFHVNAEDPDACVLAASVAMEIRQKFGCDVFIDLCCYRKYGHNEGDEPAFTQPVQYKVIRSKSSIKTMYKDSLIAAGVVSLERAQQMEAEFKSLINEQVALVPAASQAPLDPDDHYKISEQIAFELPPIDAEKVRELASRFCQVPQGFAIHPKVQRLFKDRLEMFSNDPLKPCIDFGASSTYALLRSSLKGSSASFWTRLSKRDLFSEACRLGRSEHHGEIFPLKTPRPAPGPL